LMATAYISFCVPSAAFADTYSWVYEGPGMFGSGTLTDNGGAFGSGFLIDSFTGNFFCTAGCSYSPFGPSLETNVPATLLPPGSIALSYAPPNDNILYPNANAPGGALLDTGGLGLLASNGFAFQIFNDAANPNPLGTGYTQLVGGDSQTIYGYGDFCIVSDQGQETCPAIHQYLDRTAPVPSPLVGAGLPGLIAACGALLGWCRRKRAYGCACCVAGRP
jgi:hypothetical protein